MAQLPPAFTQAQCKPIPIARFLNFPGKSLRGAAARKVADLVRTFATGAQKSWGIPFLMAPKKSGPRAILLRRGDEARLPVGARADFLCVLHTFAKLETDTATYLEAAPLGEYVLLYADGSSHHQPIRARLDVPTPDSPGPAQLAVSFNMMRPSDPVAPLVARPGEPEPPWYNHHWGSLPFGIGTGRGEPRLHAFRNPHPEKLIREIVIRGLVASPILVAGLTAYRGSDHPLRHLSRRMYRVRQAGGPAKVRSLTLDLGAVARVDRSTGARDKAWLKSPYTGVTKAAEPEKNGEDIFSLYGARDATVTAKVAGRAQPVAFWLGEAHETGRSARGNFSLERLGGAKQWMQVEILDASTGRPTAARLNLSGAAGEYIAPYGHHEQVNDNWFEDYGADAKIAGRSYAYVPGVFTTDLPVGDLYVELSKGFEFEPMRCKVAIRPGQKKLTLRLNRWKDLRAKGWVTADTHVHFISPHTAWLEAQCEGVNVVNLLATQWGRAFTNVGDITGRVGVVEDDTVVWVGTENRHHMLGHISLLGTKGLPVFPMCCGGATETWLAEPEFRTLTEWARECKAKDGVVIRPHFPMCGFTEDAVLAVSGVVDALEIRVGQDDAFPLQEWYRYLNAGYRVAVAGGTDKMASYTALGYLRTYAQLDPQRPFTYENWARAIRAGRCYATTGPLMEFEVEGRRMGEAISLPASGARLQVRAAAESAWPLGRIELVQNGRVVASEFSRADARKLAVSAKVDFPRSGWIAARCSGAANSPAGYMAAHTSPVYVTCGRKQPFDGPAIEHMLNLTRGGIEYLDTISTPMSARDQQRIIGLFRQVERHLINRLNEGHHHAAH